MHEKILLVDDENNVLQAIRRNLQHRFDLMLASNAVMALDALKSSGQIAVVISDLRMPGMDGIRLLSLVREQYPHAVRILLTGHADLQTAIEAVNSGNIFRLLTKPCPPEMICNALNAGLAQYRLARAEKELLEKTLHGSVKVLADVLAMTNPTAFGRGARLLRMARMLAIDLKIDNLWEVELGAMLSQIGCVTVPESILQKAFNGLSLDSGEAALVANHPRVGSDLIANIPRMENVAEIIAHQSKTSDEEKKMPIGARILQVAADFDTLTSSGKSSRDALNLMQLEREDYDSRVINSLNDVLIRMEAGSRYNLMELSTRDLREGMIFAEDVFTVHNVLLIARGQDVTIPIILRLRNFVGNAAVREPFKMLTSVEKTMPG